VHSRPAEFGGDLRGRTFRAAGNEPPESAGRMAWNEAGRIIVVRAGAKPHHPGSGQSDAELTQMTVQGETTTQGIVLTEAAAGKVGNLLQQEGRDDLRLRIAVQPGGCSGLRYQLYFDERQMDGDVVSEFGGVQVVTDKMSVPYLSGATVDFVDTIEKQGFTIDNPNAGGSCACGDSFH
jgi:iron-sulfur cluster assembly accessory protein